MRKAIENSIEINCKPYQAIAAFTKPRLLKKWWHVQQCLIDLKPGGVYVLGWEISEDGIGFINSGIISRYDASTELLVTNWVYLTPGTPFLGPMELYIHAILKGKNTLLTVKQDGYHETISWEKYYQAAKSAWPIVLESIKDCVEQERLLFGRKL